MAITINVNIGDTILTGKFRNKKTVIKNITTDEHGMPVINGKKCCTFRIDKSKPSMTQKQASLKIERKNMNTLFERWNSSITEEIKSQLIEGNMSELDIIRQESKTAEEFVKNVFKDSRFKKLLHKNKSTVAWLIDMFKNPY